MDCRHGVAIARNLIDLVFTVNSGVNNTFTFCTMQQALAKGLTLITSVELAAVFGRNGEVYQTIL